MDIEVDSKEKKMEQSKKEEELYTLLLQQASSDGDKSKLLPKDFVQQKQALKNKFQLLVNRLTNGCGRKRCRYDTCINFIGNKVLKNNPVAARQKALEIMKERSVKLLICEMQTEEIKPLQRKEVEKLLSPSSLKDNFLQVLGRVQQIFQNFDALNSSFQIEQNLLHNVKDIDGQVDVECIYRMFNTFFTIQDLKKKKSIEEAFKSSFIKTLGGILKHSDFLFMFQGLEDLKILAILILYPPLFQQDLTLFDTIKSVFFFLQEIDYEAISNWLQQVPIKEFQQLVERVKMYVMTCVYFSEQNQAKLLELEAGMNVLKILFKSNEIKNRIKNNSFILDIFKSNNKDKLNPKDEYRAWLKSRTNTDKDKRVFSFCNYPFSMDIQFKYLLLEINSKHSQQIEHEKKIQNLFVLGHIFINQAQLFLTFEVSRDNILQDTIKCITKPQINYGLPFRVKFQGEHGVDEGGVRKEFYQIMIKQLLNEDFGLFVQKNNKQYFWFNGNSLDMPILFELIGSLMGIAIYNQIQMDVRFPTVIYKKLLGEMTQLEDIKQFDPQTYNGLKHVLAYEGDLENDLQQTFSLEYEVFDEPISIELKPGGDNIPVTQENKKEYIELYVDWILNKSIEKQFSNFKRGFFKVLDQATIKLFTQDELVLILTGKEEIDFKELQRATAFDSGYDANSDQIKQFLSCFSFIDGFSSEKRWLWEVLDQFNLEQKKRFLFFCTGSDRVPVTGFASLNFVIAKHGDDNDHLPSAQTCYNHLLLPKYKSKDTLRQKLLLSLENAEGFGLH